MLGSKEWFEPSIYDDDYLEDEESELSPLDDDYVPEEYRDYEE